MSLKFDSIEITVSSNKTCAKFITLIFLTWISVAGNVCTRNLHPALLISKQILIQFDSQILNLSEHIVKSIYHLLFIIIFILDHFMERVKNHLASAILPTTHRCSRSTRRHTKYNGFKGLLKVVFHNQIFFIITDRILEISEFCSIENSNY